ncbi:hypothetical protein UPYG_G00080920 [Umbra pygmaea]|uniref:Uncharacterized protein n=1 Tax=Umbra pygmaea TaxID=75934 RepID=A0ABD0XGP3_UMBPY
MPYSMRKCSSMVCVRICLHVYRLSHYDICECTCHILKDCAGDFRSGIIVGSRSTDEAFERCNRSTEKATFLNRDFSNLICFHFIASWVSLIQLLCNLRM